ncbi:MAG: class I SAM-dependent methyltransferase [Anaerolineae bacterium]
MSWRCFPLSLKSRVLDIGMGPGVAALSLRALKDCQVYGIEQVGRTWLRNPHWRERVLSQADVRVIGSDVLYNHLPFRDGSFDAALLMEVIEHLPVYPLPLLQEIRRILRPGGVLVLTTPNFASVYNLVGLARGCDVQGYGWYNNPTDDPIYYAHVFEYTIPELRRLLWAAGFTVDRIEYADYGVKCPWYKLYWRVALRMFPHLKPSILVTAYRGVVE